MLSQYETTAQLSRWAAEKQCIISTANSKRWTDHELLVWEPIIDAGAFDNDPATEGFRESSRQDNKQERDESLITEAFRNLSIQASHRSSATYVQPVPSIANVQTPKDQEKSQPRPRYTITEQSLNVIRPMFPSGSQDRGTVDWLNFVSLLSEVGYVEVRHVCLACTFTRSITFPKPHPRTDMGAVLL